MLLKTLMNAARSLAGRGTDTRVDHPLEVEERVGDLHRRADPDHHLEILYGDVRIGRERFLDLYRRCLAHTGTVFTPFNVFQRFQTRLDLLRYFLATLDVPGARVECGAYRGATALLMCEVWRDRQPGFSGEDMFLIDSFMGTSASGSNDFIPVRDGPGSATRMDAFFPVAKTDVTAEMVRGFFSGFPQAQICAGWIPGVFNMLPERNWAFVHLDLTLYEPTLAALEYFYPRLSPGGAILCDGSIFCPGAQKAWDDYCAEHDIPFVALGHRESVIVKAR